MRDGLSDDRERTVRDVLTAAEGAMPEKGTSRLDALILVELACGVDRSRLLAELRTPLADLLPEDDRTGLDRLEELVARRRRGTPIAYIVGSKEFFGRDFAVGLGVLVPRPETEHLVEAALDLLHEEETAAVHDCCCGSGCVGISIAAERAATGRATRLLLSDRSPEARRWAEINATSLLGASATAAAPPQLVEWRIAAADLLTLDAVDEMDGQVISFDVITANPPYLTTRETTDALTRGWCEPAMALDGGPDGLEPYRRLAGEAFRALRPGGWVVIEHGATQAAPVRELLRNAGFRDTETIDDLAGLPRLVKARRGAENW